MIWYLNPWVNRSDTLNISTGNPYLDPELNHGLELSHNFFTPKGLSFNSAVYWRYTDNAIEYLSTVDEKGISLHRPENIAERITYGINTNISGQITKSWNMNGMIELQYLKVGSDKLSQSNKGFVKRVNMNTSYKLSKNFTLQGNGGFGSSWVNLQTKHSPFYWYSLAAKYEFLDNKANLTLGVNNPFNKYMIQTSEAKAPTFLSNSRSHFLNRSVRLTFEWRFGQMSNGRGKTGKKIMNDDRDR